MPRAASTISSISVLSRHGLMAVPRMEHDCVRLIPSHGVRVSYISPDAPSPYFESILSEGVHLPIRVQVFPALGPVLGQRIGQLLKLIVLGQRTGDEPLDGPGRLQRDVGLRPGHEAGEPSLQLAE